MKKRKEVLDSVYDINRDQKIYSTCMTINREKDLCYVLNLYVYSWYQQISRYCTLSQLYVEIGFLRKAAFFKRIAAMQCVSPQNPNPKWGLCHTLLTQCVNGYKILMDTAQLPKGEYKSHTTHFWIFFCISWRWANTVKHVWTNMFKNKCLNVYDGQQHVHNIPKSWWGSTFMDLDLFDAVWWT